MIRKNYFSTFLLCLIGIAACSDEGSKLNPDKGRKLKNEFIDGCVKQVDSAGGRSSLCPCVIEELEKKYSLLEMYVLEKELSEISAITGNLLVPLGNQSGAGDYQLEAVKAIKKCW